MEAVREITVWKDSGNANHTYLLDGSRMIAYIPWGTGEPFYFKAPITIERRGRRFEALGVNPFVVLVDEHRCRIKGSKGAIYWVDDIKGSCTCPGWQFRGRCKHTAK